MSTNICTAQAVMLEGPKSLPILPRALHGHTDVSPYFQGVSEQEQRVVARILKLEGTPEAIREFCRSRAKLGDYTYWFMLGTLWVSYTGFSDLAMWKRLFSAQRPHRAECLMKPSEYHALASLPERFVVYRAHRPGEQDWIAYTLDPQIAAGRFAPKRGVNTIHAYEVERSHVLSLFLRRGEKEVLVLDRHHVRPLREVQIVRPEQKEEADAKE